MMKDILIAREKRWIYTNELVERFNLPIIVITLNIPGGDKCKKDYIYAHNAITKDFVKYLYENELSPIYFESRVDKDGPESFLIVNFDGKYLKKIGIKFEQNHPLGRISDIDIKDKKGVWSRKDLGLGERKCLVCSSPARACILSRKHSLEEILFNINQVISNYRTIGESE